MNAERENLLKLLTELSAHATNLRFGQMIANLASMAPSEVPDSIWDVEDHELAVAAQRLLTTYQEREATLA